MLEVNPQKNFVLLEFCNLQLHLQFSAVLVENVEFSVIDRGMVLVGEVPLLLMHTLVSF